MKETVRSLRAYFGLVGFLSGWSNLVLLSLSLPVKNYFLIILSLAGIGFAIAFLYFSFALKKLLIESPDLINQIIIMTLIFQFVLLFFYGAAGALTAVEIIRTIIACLIGWYLLTNVKRLSSELKAEQRQPPR